MSLIPALMCPLAKFVFARSLWFLRWYVVLVSSVSSYGPLQTDCTYAAECSTFFFLANLFAVATKIKTHTNVTPFKMAD